MNAVEKRLIEGLDSLNVLDFFSLSKKDMEKKFGDILEDAYIDGFASAHYFIGKPVEINRELLMKALNRSYDGQNIYEKLYMYAESMDDESAKRLIESEYHRVFNEAEYDYANESGLSIVKTWVTMMDSRVRDTHSYLQGITIPIEAEFVTYDGDRAYYPSSFSKAENNANCRCYLKLKEV